MTLTQIVGRFIKDYMPKECKDNILVGIFKNEIINGLKNRMMDDRGCSEVLNWFPDHANSLLNDFCFLFLLKNRNGTSIYGVINRIIEDKFYYSLNDYGDGRYNEKRLEKCGETTLTTMLIYQRLQLNIGRQEKKTSLWKIHFP